MAKTFSLAVYAITIHTYGNKNDRQVLSDFNNGQDFLEYMDTMITLKSASNLSGNLNCSKELEHYAS